MQTWKLISLAIIFLQVCLLHAESGEEGQTNFPKNNAKEWIVSTASGTFPHNTRYNIFFEPTRNSLRSKIADVSPAGMFSTITSVSSPPRSLDFPALEDNNTRFPPDTHGAVGPNHIVTALNSQIRIQDRNGNILATNASLETLWKPLLDLKPFSIRLTDPRILYDSKADRWILVATDATRGASLFVAISKSADPIGDYWLYEFATDTAGQLTGDYPNVGLNDNLLIITINTYSSGFKLSRIFSLLKQNFYAGSTQNLSVFDDPHFTIVPANTLDESQIVYLVTEDLDFTNITVASKIRIMSISLQVDGPIQFNQNVATISAVQWNRFSGNSEGFAPQANSTKLIDTGDSRIQSAVYRNGHIWCAHAIVPNNSPQRTSIQWFELTPAGTIIQHGFIDNSAKPYFYSYPSIAVNRNNDLLVGFSRFAADEFGGAFYSFRGSTDPANNLNMESPVISGQSSYFKICVGLFCGIENTVNCALHLPDCSTRNRWGDYSSTVVDPVNDIDFWTVQEYAGTNNHWGTWWALVRPPLPPPSSSLPQITAIQPTQPTAVGKDQTITFLGNNFTYPLTITLCLGQTCFRPLSGTQILPGGTSTQVSALATLGQPGNWTAQINEASGNSVQFPFTVIAPAPGTRPVITTTSLPDATVGTFYNSFVFAQNGTPPFVWSSSNFQIPGLTFADNGAITGTPTVAGDFSFTAHIADANGQSDEKILGIHIIPVAVNDFQIFVVGAGTSSVLVGGNANFTIGTQTSSGSPQSLSLSVNAPAGITANFAANPVVSGNNVTLSINVASTVAAGSYQVTISATNGSQLHTTFVVINVTAVPIAISSFSFIPSSVTGGLGSTGTIILSAAAPFGGAVVTLSPSVSSGPVQNIPISIFIGEGTTRGTFTVATTSVTTTTIVSITATYGSSSVTASLTVTASTPANLFSIHVTPPSQLISPGGQAIYRVDTNVVSGQPQTITFDVFNVPGPSSAFFTPPSVVVGQPSMLTINTGVSVPLGTYNPNVGATSADGQIDRTSAVLFIQSAHINFLDLKPNPIIGGAPATGTVSLVGTAPPGGALIQLASQNPVLVSVPQTITIPGGQSSVDFPINTSPVPDPQTVIVNAFYLDQSAPTNALFIKPGPEDFSLNVVPAVQATVFGGSAQYAISTTTTLGLRHLLAVDGSIRTNNCIGVSVNPKSIMTGDSTTMMLTTGACTQLGSAQIQVQAADSQQVKTFNVVLQITDFSLGVPSGGDTQTVNAGQSATYNLTVSPATGFNPSVNFSCSITPSIPACNVSPSQVQLGSGSIPIAVTVSTTNKTNAQLIGRAPVHYVRPAFVIVFGILCVACFIVRGTKVRKVLLLGFSGSIILFFVSCGGGSAVPQPGGNNGTPGTPRGTYVVTVNATSATSTRTLTLNLNVN